jgi:hypothetical protein
MENCRKGVLLLFLSVFFIAFSVPARAETVEERKAAANYDETLPAPEEVRALEEAPPATQVSTGAQPAQAVVPSIQTAPRVTSGVKTVSTAKPVATSVVLPVSSKQPVKAITSKTVAATPSVSSSKTKGVPTAGTVQPLPATQKITPKEMPVDQVFTASNPSGLVEVSGYKYPVFLFAPKDYKTDRTYAMIMIAPAENMKAEQQIEYLTGLAQRRSLFILAPYVLWPKAGDTPYALDAWLLSVKKDVMERFPISKKRVYLIGKDSGANYAAYLAVKYPQEFAAVALLGEAWDGPFSQLVNLRSDAANQVPFYVALKTDGNARSRNQAWFDKLQQKGYPLHLADYKNDEDLNNLEFKKSVFDWMETTGQSWETSVAQSQQTWKGKFKKGVKDFFAV